MNSFSPLGSSISFDQNQPPQSELGFGVPQNTYACGRVGVAVGYFGGITKLHYWGTLPENATPSFFQGDPTTAYNRLFRAQLVVNGEPYNLEFAQTSHFPFGYSSHFALPEKGVEVLHELTLLNDALVFSLTVLRNDQGLPLSQHFEHHEGTATAHPIRTRSPWEAFPALDGWSTTAADHVADSQWEAELAAVGRRLHPHEPPHWDAGIRDAVTRIALFSDTGRLSKRDSHSHRLYFTGEDSFTQGTHACALLFGPDDDAFLPRAQALKAALPTLAQETRRAYFQRLQSNPILETGNPAFESLLANTGPTLESLMIRDIPGALRANSMFYWVWGWDSLISSEVYLLNGRADFVREMLRMFRETAHPDEGYAHMFTRTMRTKEAQAPAAQTLYLIVLYNYFAHTGDLATVKESYRFIAQIFERILRTNNAQGLGEGRALFPDFPHLAGHNGHDISIFNNSLLYQGARAMEALASAVEDRATAGTARKLSRQMEASFVESFWDKERGYFVDSIDSRTGEQRPTYPAHALVWQTPFLEDLAGEKLAECGRFQAKNHFSLRGFRMYPRWDFAFDADGNQMGQVWNTHDVFTTRCQAAADQQEVLEKWIEGRAWFWQQLTTIEGYSAQTVNDSGTPDLPGCKQAFGVRSVYMAFLTGLAGLHFDTGGLTLKEGLERPLTIGALPFRGATLRCDIQGRGRHLRRLEVNGTAVTGSRKIPSPLLTGAVHIVCERTPQAPQHPVLLSLNDGEVLEVSIQDGVLLARLAGGTHAWLHYHSPAPASVRLDGEVLSSLYDPATGEGKVLLPLEPGASRKLEIAAH